MNPVRLTLVVYLLLIGLAVSYPIGPARAPHKLRWLNDTKPGNTEAMVRDVATNVGLFLPAGLLAGRAFGASTTALMVVIVSGGVVSLGIESAQHLFMPWRYSTWVDVVSNTAGTALGGGAAWLVDPARAWIGSLPPVSSDP
jgi:glycopeptide antibiotics resistance protein